MLRIFFGCFMAVSWIGMNVGYSDACNIVMAQRHSGMNDLKIGLPDTILILQSDRSKLHVVCDGNPFISYCETTDGYTLVLDPIGMYEYAAKGRKGDLVPMGMPAKDLRERSPSDIRALKRIPKHLRYTGKKLQELEDKQKRSTEGPAILKRDKKP